MIVLLLSRSSGDSNFFNFIERHVGGDVTAVFPDRHETLFLDFLEYLRCFSERPRLMWT